MPVLAHSRSISHEALDVCRGVQEMTDDTLRDLEDFPFDEEEENEHLGKPTDAPLEGTQSLVKRCACAFEPKVRAGLAWAKPVTALQNRLSCDRMQH